MTTDDQNDDPQDASRLRQMYEEANARAAAAQAEAAELRTREVFRDAGLDLTNRQHQAFVRAYDGAAEPDAVRAYVNELGIAETSAPPPPPEVPVTGDADQAALIRMAEAARDGGGAPPPQPDHAAELERQLDEAYRRHAPISEIDRLSLDWAEARGTTVRRQG